MSLRYLFVDLDSYFASCEQEITPCLRGKPVAVVPTMADTTCCIAASYEAKAFGVKTGTMVREAKLKCPGIQFVEGNHKEYVRIHHQVIAAVERCIPVSAVQSIDEMYAELPPNWRDETKARQIAQQINQTIAQDVGRYIGCSIGIGPNVFSSKMASGMRKPRGLVVIHQEDLPRVFFDLELRDIYGIGFHMEQRLHRAGIHTVQALCTASRDTLIRLWSGVEGDRLYRELRGEIVERPPTVRRQVGHSHVLPPQQRNALDAFEVLHRLTQKAATRLRAMGYYCGKIQFGAHLENHQRWEQEATFFETCQTPVLLHHLSKAWNLFPFDRAPQKVWVVLSNLLSSGQYSPSLFSQQQDLRNERLDRTMDAINQRLGSRTVYYAGQRTSPQSIPLRIAFTHIPNLDVEQG
jgi:DNA polymerase-4